MSLSLTASSGIPGDLPVVFSLAKCKCSAWWTKYFPRSYGIEIENNSESRESSAIGDFRKYSEIESNSEFKESSEIWDSSKDSTEASSLVELRQKAIIHSDFDIPGILFFLDPEVIWN